MGRGIGARWLLEHTHVGDALAFSARPVLQPILDSPSETVGAFVNPADPKVRAHVLALLGEIADRYAIDDGGGDVRMMRTRMKGHTWRLVALAASVALVATGCSSSGSKQAATVNAPTTTVPPHKGGTLTLGASQEPACADWLAPCGNSSHPRNALPCVRNTPSEPCGPRPE